MVLSLEHLKRFDIGHTSVLPQSMRLFESPYEQSTHHLSYVLLDLFTRCFAHRFLSFLLNLPLDVLLFMSFLYYDIFEHVLLAQQFGLSVAEFRSGVTTDVALRRFTRTVPEGQILFIVESQFATGFVQTWTARLAVSQQGTTVHFLAEELLSTSWCLGLELVERALHDRVLDFQFACLLLDGLPW